MSAKTNNGKGSELKGTGWLIQFYQGEDVAICLVQGETIHQAKRIILGWLKERGMPQAVLHSRGRIEHKKNQIFHPAAQMALEGSPDLVSILGWEDMFAASREAHSSRPRK